MAKSIGDKTIFSLLEVTRSIGKTITERYKSVYWIKAEMSKLNYYPQSGHCYPTLVEKTDGKVVAEIKGILWKSDYQRINAKFLREIREPLKNGIKILFSAKITYDPTHNLALNIIDIDTTFTGGDLENEKRETIQKLRAEGIFNRNKALKLSLLPQRIAIISVQTSNGYLDFLGKIEKNSWGYTFFHMLFPSLLQGEKVIASMIGQLKRIRKVISHFDAVAIIRGGGGEIGLSFYNNYKLAKEVALFPIPVLAGIGHITNETVVEMVSHKNFITPTDLANFLFQEYHNFSVPLQKAEEKISHKSKLLIRDEKEKLHSQVRLFRSITENILNENRSEIKRLAQSLFQQAQFLFKRNKEHLFSIKEEIIKRTHIFFTVTKQGVKQFVLTIKKEVSRNLTAVKLIINVNAQKVARSSGILIFSGKEKIVQSGEKIFDRSFLLLKSETVQISNIEKNINNMSPANVLKRGYSITLLKGKAVKNIDEVKEGDTLDSILFEGNIISIVKSATKPGEL